MELPRFLIAKCIPDVFRNEPRNIGVVLWSPDGILARFVGEKSDAPSEVDESQLPPFITSPEAYKQWMQYWRRQIGKEAIRSASGGPLVSRTSSAFLDTLAQTDHGNFVLADGGMFAEPVPAHELPQALDYVFENYVAEPPTIAAESDTATARDLHNGRPSESIIVANNIKITLVSVGGRVGVGIEAPPDVRVDRKEIHDKIEQSSDGAKEHAEQRREEALQSAGSSNIGRVNSEAK